MNNLPIQDLSIFGATGGVGLIELLILLLVSIFVLIFIIAFIAKKWSGGAALIVGIGLIGLLGGGVLLTAMVYWRMSAVAHQPTFRASILQAPAPPSVSPVPAQATGGPRIVSSTPREQISAWDDSISATANIYPGIPECGAPLASRIADALIAKDSNSKTRYTVKLTNEDLTETNRTKLAVQFLNTFKAKMPANSVTNTYFAKKATPPTEDAKAGSAKAGSAKVGPKSPVKIVNVQITKVIEESRDHASGLSDLLGQVVCEWSVDDGETFTLVVEFTDKPWVSNPSKFFSSPAGKNKLVAYSSRLASSQNEAHRSAMEAFRRQFRESQNRAFQSGYSAENAIADRFVQKLTMPYGSVWREAVLVKTDIGTVDFHHPISVDAQADMTNARPANVSSSRVRTSPEFWLALLAGLIIAVGWVSNVLTQGYYRKPINTATLIGVSIGVIVLILLVVLSIA
jgi:hypothetical protein